MHAVDNVTGVNGTRLPAPAVVEAHVERGFLLEVLRYASTTTKTPAPIHAPRGLATARDAVRAIRLQVRTAHVAGMTPRETQRAIEWAESGWMQAIGLLKAGEPCGFTIMLGTGAVVEWRVRPLRYLTLTTPPCCRHQSPQGRRDLSS